MKGSLIAAIVFFSGAIQAHNHLSNANPALVNSKKQTIIVGDDLAQALNLDIMATHQQLGVSIAEASAVDISALHVMAHKFGRCGGFEILESGEMAFSSLQTLADLEERNLEFSSIRNILATTVFKDKVIEDALDEVDPANLKKTVDWLVSFKTRAAKSKKPNAHVTELKKLLEKIAKDSDLDIEIELVDHKNTKQKSLSARIEGNSRPDEIIVLGGHLDSINQNNFMGLFDLEAPGADDNASGSANLVEAFRILMDKEQPERTIQFFWYAAEEEGLVGSSEIAKAYKKAKEDVVAVLQLDMTLFDGSGEFTLGSMTDFTSSWLRKYLEDINTTYLNGKILESKCGYGCSDHASWHRQGYPALMPFEAAFDDMNGRIHTTSDVVDKRANFDHSAMFTKIALIMAMDLGNSLNRQPF